MEFLKSYVLGSILMIVNLPRFLLFVALFMMPNLGVAYVVSFVLAGGNTVAMSNPNDVIGIISGLTGFVSAVYLLEKTMYGEIMKKVWPF